jgi:arylsulfatase A-like enzyme
MTRLIFFLVTMFAMFCSLPANGETRLDRPNIVFILADDLGWSDTTLFGTTKFYQTPNVERLAKRGMLFTRAYSASPLCSPTRSAILTGLSPARTGITTPNCHLPQVVLDAQTGTSAPPDKKSIQPTPVTRLKTEYHTLAETFKAAGYATGHFGKWHLGREPYSPLQQGFDVDLPHWPGPGPAGSYVAPWKFTDFDHDPDVPDQHIEDRMAQEAVAFMEQHQSEPFFLNYWMFSVHAPFDAKKSLIEKHRARVNPDDPQRSPTYAAMIESMDDAVGTLLDTLDRLGLAENTIVVFTSDNGGNMYSEIDDTVPTSNAPLRGGKASMFEGGTRVPCVIVWPGVVQSNTRNDTLVQSEDFYPTLLEATELQPEPKQRFDGVSIMSALKGGSVPRDAIFQYFPHDPGVPDWLPPSVSVHRGDWKLIRIFHGGDNGAHRYLLFNLRDDLSEQHNLAAENPDLVRQLDALIDEFLADTQAVVPIVNPKFDPSKYRPEDEGKQKVKNKPKADSASATKADGQDNPQLQGWKARGCNAAVNDGIVTITGSAKTPFLGVAPGKLGAESKLRFRLSGAGGEGKVEWLASGKPEAAKSTPFVVKAGDWAEFEVEIPAQPDEAGILRLYLPAQDEKVRIDWIEIESSDKTKRWDF